ncbi:MAG TPA: hypothetical protein VF101_01135 [Gaiellaceae bacterium]
MGSAAIGKSDPARNHGTIAIAGTRAMYSSAFGTRLASVSAAPYIAIVKSDAAAANHATPATLASKWIPRATATAISASTWSAVTANATTMFPKTSSERGTGAARSSRRAPLSRSTITPSPANIVFSGISRPTVPVATKDSYSELVWSASFSAGAITSANRIGVSRGTTSSRGVRAASLNLRAASVASGASGFCAAGRARRVMSGDTGVISALLSVVGVRRPRRGGRRSSAGTRRRASARGC